jgi:hypothetical protein
LQQTILKGVCSDAHFHNGKVHKSTCDFTSFFAKMGYLPQMSSFASPWKTRSESFMKNGEIPLWEARVAKPQGSLIS